MSDFDARKYWEARLSKLRGLEGTGSLGGTRAWQYWLYRGKERAYRRLLSRHPDALRGAHVLNFGCGYGYFEDLWERWGAAEVFGIDIARNVIEANLERTPRRHYRAGDLSEDPELLADWPTADLVTAIDVAYHIVDDEKLEQVLAVLVGKIRPGGLFLVTDSPMAKTRAAKHVRFRSQEVWTKMLAKLELSIVDREPVFLLNNRSFPGRRRLPWLAGIIQHTLDYPALRLAPHRANNWAFLARKAVY